MLYAPITLKEIKKAIGSLQTGKTPSDDGLSPEFFQTYSDSLVMKRHEVLVSSLDAASLPASML